MRLWHSSERIPNEEQDEHRGRGQSQERRPYRLLGHNRGDRIKLHPLTFHTKELFKVSFYNLPFGESVTDGLFKNISPDEEIGAPDALNQRLAMAKLIHSLTDIAFLDGLTEGNVHHGTAAKVDAWF